MDNIIFPEGTYACGTCGLFYNIDVGHECRGNTDTKVGDIHEYLMGDKSELHRRIEALEKENEELKGENKRLDSIRQVIIEGMNTERSAK